MKERVNHFFSGQNIRREDERMKGSMTSLVDKLEGKRDERMKERVSGFFS